MVAAKSLRDRFEHTLKIKSFPKHEIKCLRLKHKFQFRVGFKCWCSFSLKQWLPPSIRLKGKSQWVEVGDCTFQPSAQS